MGANHNPDLKAGIKFNGTDIFNIHPDQVREAISQLPEEQKEIAIAIMKSKIGNRINIPDNYAEHAGRPSITKLPYMSSQNDGLPYLLGHSPSCSGEIKSKTDFNTNSIIRTCDCKYNSMSRRGEISNNPWLDC